MYIGGREIEIFDLTEITTPTRLGFINITESCPGKVFYKNYVFTMNNFEFAVYNATDVSNFSKLGTYEALGGMGLGFFDYQTFDRNKITDDRIYITYNPNNYDSKAIVIFNWTDPTNLTVLAYIGNTKYISENMSAIRFLEYLIFNLTIVGIFIVIRKNRK